MFCEGDRAPDPCLEMSAIDALSAFGIVRMQFSKKARWFYCVNGHELDPLLALVDATSLGCSGGMPLFVMHERLRWRFRQQRNHVLRMVDRALLDRNQPCAKHSDQNYSFHRTLPCSLCVPWVF